MTLRLLPLVLLAATALAGLEPAAAQSPGLGGRALHRGATASPPKPPGWAPAKRLVVLLDNAPITPLLDQTQTTVADALIAKGLYLLEAPAGTTDTELSLLLAQLEGEQGVVFAEADARGQPSETEGCGNSTSGDPAAHPQQCTVGFVDGTPTTAEYIGQSAVSQIRADDAQAALPHPFSAVVAVIDTGLDMSHPLFAGRLFSDGYDFVDGHPGAWEVADGVDDDGDGLADEAYGHGTHVAGSILLVDPGARLLPVRALDSDGVGSGYRLAEALFYAVDSGADVINLSVSMQVTSLAVVSALQYAEALGVTVVTSAGNTGGEVLFPGNYDPASVTWQLPLLPPWLVLDGAPVVTVTAVDAADHKADFAAAGPFVDLSSPGVDVYSAFPGGGYAWWSGTSMATGVASGAAALMLGIGGPWPLTDAAQVLQDNAENIDALNPGYVGALGAGRIDAFAAGLDALSPL